MNEDPVQVARSICPKLLAVLQEKYPEYIVKYSIYCHEYLSGKVSRTQQLLAANDVLLTYAWLGGSGE